MCYYRERFREQGSTHNNWSIPSPTNVEPHWALQNVFFFFFSAARSSGSVSWVRVLLTEVEEKDFDIPTLLSQGPFEFHRIHGVLLFGGEVVAQRESH